MKARVQNCPIRTICAHSTKATAPDRWSPVGEGAGHDMSSASVIKTAMTPSAYMPIRRPSPQLPSSQT